jgi:hypothetical protein
MPDVHDMHRCDELINSSLAAKAKSAAMGYVENIDLADVKGPRYVVSLIREKVWIIVNNNYRLV